MGRQEEQQMVRVIKRFFARPPAERAMRFRQAHQRAGLPDPAIPYVEPPPLRPPIPWKFKHAR